ncbi:MAG: hypothetical protein ACTSSP_11795 [Candidatus Asgardarchaeia archaeon]
MNNSKVKKILLAGLIIILFSMASLVITHSMENISNRLISNRKFKTYGVFETIPENQLFFKFKITTYPIWIVGENVKCNISLLLVSEIVSSARVKRLDFKVFSIDKNKEFVYTIIPNEEISSLSIFVEKEITIEFSIVVLTEFQDFVSLGIYILFEYDTVNNTILEGATYAAYVGCLKVQQFPEQIRSYNSSLVMLFLISILTLFVANLRRKYKNEKAFLSMVIVLLIAILLSGIVYLIIFPSISTTPELQKQSLKYILPLNNSNNEIFRNLTLEITLETFPMPVTIYDVFESNLTVAIAIKNFIINRSILGVIFLFNKTNGFTPHETNLFFTQFFFIRNMTSIQTQMFAIMREPGRYIFVLKTIYLILFLDNGTIISTYIEPKVDVALRITIVSTWQSPKGIALLSGMITLIIIDVSGTIVIMRKNLIHRKEERGFFI